MVKLEDTPQPQPTLLLQKHGCWACLCNMETGGRESVCSGFWKRQRCVNANEPVTMTGPASVCSAQLCDRHHNAEAFSFLYCDLRKTQIQQKTEPNICVLPRAKGRFGVQDGHSGEEKQNRLVPPWYRPR